MSNRTGEAKFTFSFGSFPGLNDDFVFGVVERGYISGGSQAGGGAVPFWEHTVEENIIDALDPDSEGGTEVYWRHAFGPPVTFVSDGSGGFESSDCGVQWTLTKNSPYKLTSKHGDEWLFDSNGMPDKFTSRHGVVTDYSYNGSYQITALVDSRGQSWSFSHNGDGFLSQIQTPDNAAWDINYDSNGFIESIDYPATTDQPSGTSITITTDGKDRITEIEDRRGNTVYELSYVGATPQVDTVTIDGEDEAYSYSAGQTNRTDRAGYIHSTFYSGANITSTDMYIASSSEYLTTYTYAGNLVATAVFARGNRVDYTWDSSDNLLERRHRTTDTGTNDASDIVHTWTYSSSFMTSYTDPEGEQTIYTRNGSGDVTSISYPSVTSPSSQSASRSMTWNGDGQLTQVTDEEGIETDYTYFTTGTSVGLLKKIEVDPSGLGLETTFSYDAAGNVSGVEDARGGTTEFEWDALRRLKQGGVTFCL